MSLQLKYDVRIVIVDIIIRVSWSQRCPTLLHGPLITQWKWFKIVPEFTRFLPIQSSLWVLQHKCGLRFITAKRNITHVMTHDCISFAGPSSSAGRLMRVCTCTVSASNCFLSFCFDYFIWIMVCSPLLWLIMFVFVLFETFISVATVSPRSHSGLSSLPLPPHHWLVESQVRPFYIWSAWP